MELPNLFYGSIAIAPIIVALIALMKRAGLPIEWAPWANVGLSLAFVIIIYVTNIYPDIQEPVTFGLNMLIAILTTAGFYDAQKNVTRGARGMA